jgi:hypothetical protein
MKGSPAWHNRASESDKSAFWQEQSLESMESKWAKAIKWPELVRRSISIELVRRGLDGQLFFDPEADYQRQAKAEDNARAFGQALSAGLQAVNQQNLAGPGAGTTYQNNAPTVQNNAPTVIGSQNITYRQVGNTTYGSDGTSYRQSGNTTYGSDGTSYRKSGNTTYGSDGTTYRQSGNTFYGSDGTNCRAIGNTIYCN